MQRILGTSRKRNNTKCGRGYLTYKITELLAKNPDSEFRCKDIVKELRGELEPKSISIILNSLGEIGVIGYESPYREIKGKRATGWIVYRAKRKIDYEEALEEIKRVHPKFQSKRKYPKFKFLGYLGRIIKHINKNLNEKLEYNKISDKLHIPPYQVSSILSGLEKAGYLSSEFSGKTKSRAKANEFTLRLWEKLLEPIGEAAEKLDPYVDGFREKLEFYEEKPEIWKEQIKNQLMIYQRERRKTGPKGGKEIRKAIVDVLSSSGKSMKRSHIAEEVRRKISRKGISKSAVGRQLKNLEKEGRIKKTEKGYYALK